MKFKYTNEIIAVVLAIFLVNAKGFSQSTGNNTYGSTKFLGWNATNGVNPLFFKTNNLTRIRLNGNQIYNYNGTPINVSGFFGIGLNNYFANNTPLTMLHLEGSNNTPFTFGQYRGWMKTGLFMRENSDAMYVGLKTESGTNRSDIRTYEPKISIISTSKTSAILI